RGGGRRAARRSSLRTRARRDPVDARSGSLRATERLARVTGPHGVLVVDKPAGPTSHDVVGQLRRALGTRAVGHAGTLDPAASGVLVVAIGEATKLAPHLAASDKSYLASIAFGRATDTLDAAGA